MLTADIQFKITAPPAYDGVVDARGERIAVEHARLNGRILELTLARAFRDSLAGERVVVFTSLSFSRAKHLLARWAKSVELKFERFQTRDEDCTYLQFGKLWVVFGKMFSVERFPFTNADVVYGVGCDAMNVDISAFFPHARAYLTGELASRDHWFYSYARHERTVLHQLPAALIVSAFPDQALRVMPKTDPYYERAMELKDVEPKFTYTGFRIFAKTRLWCKTDKPIEFLSERQKAIAQGQRGTPIVPMEVSALQNRYLARKRLARMQGKRPWFLTLKYRRGGITTIEQGESYTTASTVPHASVLTLAHTRASTSRIWKIVQLYYEKDPNKLRRLSNADKHLELENGASFFVGTAGGHGVARGDTLQRVHGSEVSKWCLGPSQMEKQEDLIAGLTGAAEHGEVCFETTPNGHEWFWREWQLIKNGQSEFTGIFLRWFDDPINRCKEGQFNATEIIETLSDEEIDLVKRFKLDASQVAYRRMKKREYKRLFPQEMPEDDVSCFLASGTCYFDIDLIQRLLRELPPATRTHIAGGYVEVYEQPVDGVEYIAGADTSEGLPGCDQNGLGVMRRDTGAQVCSIHGLFSPRLLGEIAVTACRKYNNALLAIERNNHGHAVIQKVEDLGYGKPLHRGGSLFYDARLKSIKVGSVDVGESKYGRAGWNTDEGNRAIMLQDLAEAIETGAMIIRDRQFLEELLSFRLQSSGKFEHDPGAHDDTIFKWGICYQMRKFRRPKPGVSFG